MADEPDIRQLIWRTRGRVVQSSPATYYRGPLSCYLRSHGYLAPEWVQIRIGGTYAGSGWWELDDVLSEAVAGRRWPTPGNRFYNIPANRLYDALVALDSAGGLGRVYVRGLPES